MPARRLLIQRPRPAFVARDANAVAIKRRQHVRRFHLPARRGPVEERDRSRRIAWPRAAVAQPARILKLPTRVIFLRCGEQQAPGFSL